MTKVLKVLLGRWFLSFIGAASVAVLIWFLGPLLTFLESATTRLIVVAAIFLVWLIANLLLDHFARRAQKRMVDELTEAKPDPAVAAREAAQEEVALLRERLKETLKALRGTAKNRLFAPTYLYELPWYMLIGPPGSGKTTALRNSGLNFPLSDRFGRDPVRGVGGTRNCDWWLTEDAVLLDTAGRYVTQDSAREVDQQAWLGFLDLLKNFRPRQPINGAIVAIGLPDIAAMSAEERDSHARAIRARLKELRERFGLRFPVYVVFAKLDLIAGFVEFFGNLDRQAREQVWGMTFPLEAADEQQGHLSTFEAEFDALLARLNGRIPDRMIEERDVERRALIFGFPSQMALLKATLTEFLHSIFAPSRFEERALLRGVYFTSATQEGTPVDRLIAAVAQSFGIERQILPAFHGAGRGYFLTRLFKELIFGEASLVSADPRQQRRRLWRRRVLSAGVAMVALAILGAWTWSYFANRALIAQVDRAAHRYETTVTPLDERVVNDDDVARILPALDAVRQLPTGFADAGKSIPIGLTFGLYQGDKLGEEAKFAYRRSLNGLLLPRLLVGVHNQLQANLDDPSLTNVLLQVYLMLGQQGPLNGDLIERTVDTIWGNRPLSTTDQASARRALRQHVDALLAGPMPAIPLDTALVARARDVVARIPLAARAYRRIETSAAALALPPWRIIDHAGPAADQVLTRASGKPLTEGIAGLYTRDGFRKVVLVEAPVVVKQLMEETWVLGTRNTVPPTPDRVRQAVNDTVALYLQDYIRRWDSLLADIRIVPSTNLNATLNTLNALSGPASPLKRLLVAAAAETTLVPPKQANAGAAARAAAAVAAPNRALSALARAAGTDSTRLGKVVDDHFSALHALAAGAATGHSQIDYVDKLLGDLYTSLSAQAASPGATGPGAQPPISPAASQLAQMARRLPPPLGDIVASIASGSSNVSIGNTRRQIADLYLSSVLPFCRQALQGRYPIDRSSKVDISLGDFASLFRPNGVLDGFFKTDLAKYVDTTRLPWRNQRVDNVDLDLSQAALSQFQRAQAVRNAFFANGGATPSASFSVEPIGLSSNAAQVTLSVDGQRVVYAHGPVEPVSMTWPGASGVMAARLTFTPVSGASTPGLTADGPWALFRLLGKGKVERKFADQFTMAFTVGTMSASFRIHASSVRNPFQSDLLGQFRCVGRL